MSQSTDVFDGVYALPDLASHRSEPLFPELDRADPAFPSIVRQLARMMLAGIDIGPSELSVAEKLGRLEARDPTRLADVPMPELPPQESVVYYMRRGNLVKIGKTKSLQRRVRELLPDEVLAVEPGDTDLERARHCQFRHLDVGHEHFRYEDELRDHVAQMVAMHGKPALVYAPLRTA